MRGVIYGMNGFVDAALSVTAETSRETSVIPDAKAQCLPVEMEKPGAEGWSHRVSSERRLQRIAGADQSAGFSTAPDTPSEALAVRGMKKHESRRVAARPNMLAAQKN